MMYVLDICAERSALWRGFFFFVFLTPHTLLCCVCVKSTSNSTGSVLRLAWLLFHCTSPSYTQSTSNASPVHASKCGTVCFCPSCPFPVPGAGAYAGIFISKHMLDVLIPYGLIFASFWWGPAVWLWRIWARSDLWKQSLSGRWILGLTGSWHWSLVSWAWWWPAVICSKWRYSTKIKCIWKSFKSNPAPRTDTRSVYVCSIA